MSKLSYAIGIPARYDSTRFPGKPLAMLAGKPMIAHVIERALNAELGRRCDRIRCRCLYDPQRS